MMIDSMYTMYILHGTYIGQRMDILYRRPLWTTVGPKKVEPKTELLMGPLTQATGPPRSDAGVGIGMLRGNPVLSANYC